MKANVLRDLTLDELKNKLKETEDSLFSLKIKLSRKLLDNPMAIRKTRRDIPRIKTLIREKENIAYQKQNVRKYGSKK